MRSSQAGVPGSPEAALDRILGVSGVLCAAVVDLDSGLPLAVRWADHCREDLELVTAGQADLVRLAVDTFGALHRSGPPTEMVISHGERLHHLLRPVPDPFGDRLMLGLLVEGQPRVLRRVRRRLRQLPDGALVPRPLLFAPPAPDCAAVPAPTSATGGPDPRRGRVGVPAAPARPPLPGRPAPPAHPGPGRHGRGEGAGGREQWGWAGAPPARPDAAGRPPVDRSGPGRPAAPWRPGPPESRPDPTRPGLRY